VVLVTTRSNIITIGQVEYFTFKPLTMGIAVAHTRHTHGLLKDEAEFVINVPGADLLDAVRLCGSVSGRDGDKFATSGLTAMESQAVQAVSLSECGAHLECAVERHLEFDDRTWFIGPVVAARQRPGHQGMDALMCGRTHYSVPGEVLAPR
jgi:flavin reductase (DIM6/NTAB) family NADH-FMN oxidoreductase RutF